MTAPCGGARPGETAGGDPASPAGRIVAHWVYGGAVAAIVLVLLSPLVAAAYPAAVALAFLGLPAYMIHQLEEFDRDRFRVYVNALLGPSRRGLRPVDVFVINIAGVWGTFAAAILAAAFVSPGWSVYVGHALLVNGALHIAQAAALRRRNPGLVTAIVLFLPLGIAIVLRSGASAVEHAVGLGLVVLLHAAILASALRPARAGAR